MLRSEVDGAIHTALGKILAVTTLPRWAGWSRQEWDAELDTKTDISRIIKGKCGWDVTNFGAPFKTSGLVLFTPFNGWEGSKAQYCHKVMWIDAGQTCPAHTHFTKLEDIIVESGSVDFVLRNKIEPLKMVNVMIDGMVRPIEPNITLHLKRRQAIYLEPGQIHLFRGGENGAVLREISSTNDDSVDNDFPGGQPRWEGISENMPADKILYVLTSDLQYRVTHGHWPDAAA